MYLVLEGIDTCGKSTQVAKLAELYPTAIITKEPGATELGSQLRELVLFTPDLDLHTEFLLFLADRSNHCDKVIKPNLDKIIISDRSLISGMAYALASKKFDLEWLEQLNRFAMHDIMPDKIVLFQISKEGLTSRLSEKKADNIEARGIEYMLNVQRELKNVAEYLKIETLLVNAEDSIETIHQQINEFIQKGK